MWLVCGLLMFLLICVQKINCSFGFSTFELDMLKKEKQPENKTAKRIKVQEDRAACTAEQRITQACQHFFLVLDQ